MKNSNIKQNILEIVDIMKNKHNLHNKIDIMINQIQFLIKMIKLWILKIKYQHRKLKENQMINLILFKIFKKLKIILKRVWNLEEQVNHKEVRKIWIYDTYVF